MLLVSTRLAGASRIALPCTKRYLHGGAGVEFGPAIKDPSHPTGLWYHPIRSQAASPSWAISLLPDTPKSTDSVGSIGVLSLSPRLASSQSHAVPLDQLEPASVAASDPDAFRPNPRFFSWLHTTLRDEVVPNDALLDFEASQRESGWAHLADARHGLMPGRIPTPDNILATVAFVDSKLIPSTYEVNSTYRPLNAEEGWMQLREEWLAVLLPLLRKLV